MLKELMQLAFRSLIANKFRSLLAILGISIGTAAIVGILYSGLLASEAAFQEIRAMGSQMVAVSVADGEQVALNSSQIKSLSERHRSISRIIPMINNSQDFHIKNTSYRANLLETSADLKQVMNINLAKGRFIDFVDAPGVTCVLGAKVAHDLRQHGNLGLLGGYLYYANGACLVVGVLALAPDNFFLPSNINNSVITKIPEVFSDLHDILIYFHDGLDVMAAATYTLADLHAILPGMRLYQRTPGFILEHMKTEKHNMDLLLSIIGGISLLVGGIGIMNIMLVSVVERRQEIGIRMSVGARPYDIRKMFLVEAVVLCLLGGFFGVILGITLSLVLAWFSNWENHFYLWPMVLGFVVSALSGVFFGYYPASRAASVDPVVCLRGI